MASHLRLVSTGPPDCRSLGCDFPGHPPRGYCAPCEAVYQAAHQLREQLLARRAARLRARHRVLLDALTPGLRERLVTHMAARNADRHDDRAVLDMAGLDDFLCELKELSLR